MTGDHRSAAPLPRWATTPAVRWMALLGLVAAYLQGGLDKLADIPAAVGELQHFGLEPARPLAMARSTRDARRLGPVGRPVRRGKQLRVNT